MSSNAEKSAELVGRLERLPFSRWHRNFFLLAFLGVMFDAADFALFGAALPPIAREFGLGPAQAGLLATVGLVGAFLGALFWGTISDYIGRRTSFQATVGIFALFTGLVAASWNVASLGVFRFLSNFGLGGEVPVTLTLTSEFSPGRIRGRMTGTMMAGFPVGLVVAAALSLAIVPNFGWRALFIVGIVPAILLFFVRRYMPESVRYLLSKGRVAEAERTVEQIERETLGQGGAKVNAVPATQAVPEAVAETGAAAAHRVTVFELLAPGRRKRTILLWIVSFCFLWSSNGICERASPDSPARDRGGLVLRHWPHRLVSRARRGRLHAGLWARRLCPAHLRPGVPDRLVRAVVRRHRDQGSRPRADHREDKSGMTLRTALAGASHAMPDTSWGRGSDGICGPVSQATRVPSTVTATTTISNVLSVLVSVVPLSANGLLMQDIRRRRGESLASLVRCSAPRPVPSSA